jgi:hypothetical protein
MGTSVHVNPEGNIVTITKKEIPENYTRNIESYMEERINLINEIINSNKSELPVEVLSEMSMDQLRNILKC